MDAIAVALRVADTLESIGVEYLVGGSLASSLVGEPRSTLDVDLVVRLGASHVRPLVERLGREFYADPESLARTVRERSRANLVHAPSGLKIDLFVLGAHPFEQGQMARRRRVRVASEPDRFLYTDAPEDIVLQKLRWFRLGNEVSDRQWRDVLAVLRLSGADLDRDDLHASARAFGVEDLLDRALVQAGEDP